MKEQRTSYRAGLGNYASKVEAALGDIQNRDLVKRIWAKDHTVWRPDPTEITNRLGWLTVTDTMREQVADLEAFAREIRDTGFQHVVLLGMGGSSLGPEVLRQTIGPHFLHLTSVKLLIFVIFVQKMTKISSST